MSRGTRRGRHNGRCRTTCSQCPVPIRKMRSPHETHRRPALRLSPPSKSLGRERARRAAPARNVDRITKIACSHRLIQGWPRCRRLKQRLFHLHADQVAASVLLRAVTVVHHARHDKSPFRAVLDHHIAIGPIAIPSAKTANAQSQPCAVCGPPARSSATPVLQAPAAESPKPTVE
jgi:hypothetical protein